MHFQYFSFAYFCHKGIGTYVFVRGVSEYVPVRGMVILEILSKIFLNFLPKGLNQFASPAMFQTICFSTSSHTVCVV